MRIAFCGKGGSGKSTLSALMAQYLAAQAKDVLVVDGDINQHLGAALGFSEVALAKQPKIGMDSTVLKKFAKGENPRIPSMNHMTESCPAGVGSGLLSFHEGAQVWDYYQIKQGTLRFMAVGGHDDTDAATTCYHKFTGAFGILLNHFVDDKDEYIIGDMCAGADPFASSGLASRFDAIFLVVEPTLKSLSVYKQCREYADMFGVRLYVIGNKVENTEDADFIQAKVGADFIAAFKKSQYIKQFDKGVEAPISELEHENRAVLKKILSVTDSLEKDWAQYQKIGLQFHQAAATGWANAMYGLDIMDFVDPNFSYESAQEKAA